MARPRRPKDRRAPAPPRTGPRPWAVVALGLAALAAGGWYLSRDREPDPDLRQGLEWAGAHRYDQALPLLQRAAERNPRDPTAVTGLAYALLATAAPPAEVLP